MYLCSSLGNIFLRRILVESTRFFSNLRLRLTLASHNSSFKEYAATTKDRNHAEKRLDLLGWHWAGGWRHLR